MLKPVLGSQIQFGHPDADGLIALWLFNEGIGSKEAYDLSGNGLTGTLAGDAHSVPGKFGSALSFDGTGDWVSLGSTSVFDAMKAVSVIAWCKVISYNEDGIIAFYNSGAEQTSIKFSSSTLREYNTIGVNAGGHNSANIAALQGEWLQVGWTYSETAFSQFYVNGLPSGAGNQYTDNINVLANGFDVFIGQGGGGGLPYTGLIDHVLLYNRALSAQEIQQSFISPFCMFQREHIGLYTAATSGAAVDVTVEPDALALALTQHTPTVSFNVTVEPSTLELAVDLHAPTVLFPIQTILPSTSSLAATLHAPTIDVGGIVSITTWAGLHAMRNNLADDYELDADLDENSAGYATYAAAGANGGLGWIPVGTSLAPFTGSLVSAGGHTISDLCCNDASASRVGLFGYTKATAITNIGIINCTITADNGGSYAGGLIGFQHWDAGPVSGCFCTGSVTGAFAGGLIGGNYGEVLLCSTYDMTLAGQHDVGGLIGYNQGDVTDCFSHAVVDGDEWAGGLFGYCPGGTTDKCYSTGAVTGALNVGGLMSFATGATVTNSFWDTQTSGQATSAGGTGKTTAEMKDVDTFTETDTVGLTNPWDFVGNPNDDVANDDYWDIDNYYPFLTALGDPYVLIEPVIFELALTQHASDVFDIITVTPSTLALVLTQHASDVFDIITVIPDTLVLALTLQTPVVSDDWLVLPDTFALAATLHAPVITISTIVKPSDFVLAATLHAPDARSGYPEMPPAMRASLIDPYAGGAWLWLAEIYIPGYNVIRIARNTEDVVYAGITYTANNFDVGMAALSGDGSVPRYALRIAQDADHTLEDKINATKGACGGWVKVIRAHEDQLTYFIEELEQVITILSAGSDAKHVSFALGIPDPLIKKIPIRRYSSKKCPYSLPGLFKGIECGYSGGDSFCTGKLEDCDDKGNVVRWGGELGLDPNVAKV